MQACGRLFCQGICELLNYIIPIPGAPPAGIAGAGSLMSATTDSVVNNVEATLVAFCNALLVTFTGSRIPASTMFIYSSFAASNPTPGSLSRTLLMMTASFGGYELIMDAYDIALKEKYRFGAYGDAMLIL